MSAKKNIKESRDAFAVQWAVFAHWIQRAYFEGFGDGSKEIAEYHVAEERWKDSFARENFELLMEGFDND